MMIITPGNAFAAHSLIAPTPLLFPPTAALSAAGRHRLESCYMAIFNLRVYLAVGFDLRDTASSAVCAELIKAFRGV